MGTDAKEASDTAGTIQCTERARAPRTMECPAQSDPVSSSRHAVTMGPELEGEQRVQLLAMIPPSGQVLGDELLDYLGPKEAGLPDALGPAHLTEEWTEVSLDPPPERHAKALLWPCEDLRRQQVTGGPLEHVLGCQ